MRWLALLLLFLPTLAYGQSISVPAEVKIDEPGLVTIRADKVDADAVRWYSMGPGLQTFPADVVPPKLGVFLGFAMHEGTYKVGVICAKDVGGKAVISEPQIIVVIVGKPTPPPVPPVPPGPTPIPVSGLHVLIIYETADLGKMPPNQVAILYAKEIRDYFRAKCVKEPEGTVGYRILDKDTDMSAESPVWQGAMKLPRANLPWLIVSTGTDGYSGPLPATVADTLTLLKKYAG